MSEENSELIKLVPNVTLNKSLLLTNLNTLDHQELMSPFIEEDVNVF